MSTKAEIKASAVYNKKNTVQIALRINVSTESDILNKLNQVPNKMRYIKDLIRKDIMEDAKEKKM